MDRIEFSAQQYIDDVLAGRLVVCKWARLAVERHVRDLETGAERGLIFDVDRAKTAIAFFGLLKHSKAQWAGQTIKLEPWQQFILWVIFGWYRDQSERWVETLPDGRVQDGRGTRRFRTAYEEVARKNGKSTKAAGIGLFLMVADGEPGAEVYTAATKRDQARITHGEATRMVKASPALRREIQVFKDNLSILNSASKYEPLGADADTMDGLNVHAAIIDELHAHKTRAVWDVIETATGSRRQPLIFAITTAGFDRQSLCFEEHEYTEKVLSGLIEDDSFFGIIFTLDEDDDWEDESVWVKANPNLGVSKKWDDMRRLAKQAREIPSKLFAFQRLHLNIWTQSETKWVPFEHWKQCGKAVDAAGLRGRTCYGGLDLASNIDIAAEVLVFPPQADEDDYQVLCRFFIPEENMIERWKTDRVPYPAWVRQGYITATPGNVIDYDFILAQIDEDMQAYDLQEIAFDRWGATKIAQSLMELGGDEFMIQFGQGFASMSPPMRELERLIMNHKLAHGNNPVLSWMADNLVAKTDPAGNIKPDKEKSREKIDGMVALIMALDRAMRHEGGSVYEERGMLLL
ncbi:MAG: terminase large subunit [Ammonifex sp.]|jgi:phage terminase large subunit-like protein|nr:MAG: terminase large subunit [Ammonifex sp.]